MRQPKAESRAPLDGERAWFLDRSPPGWPGLTEALEALDRGDKAATFSFSLSATRGDLLSVFAGELARPGDIGNPGEPKASAPLVPVMVVAAPGSSVIGIMPF
jgi:hypothetical protein